MHINSVPYEDPDEDQGDQGQDLGQDQDQGFGLTMYLFINNFE